MVRFSVSLNEEQNEWVEEMAKDLNGSKTQVIQMLVEKAKKDSLSANHFPDNGELNETQALKTQISTLESRLSDLESALVRTLKASDPAASSTELEAQYNLSLDDFVEDKHAEKVEDTEHSNTSGSRHVERSLEPPEGSLPTEIIQNQNTGDNTPHDPEIEAIRECVDQHTTTVASPEEIVSCWELLKKRGIGRPQTFKNYCCSTEDLSEEECERWWSEGIYPILTELPGVEQPIDNGNLLQFRY